MGVACTSCYVEWSGAGAGDYDNTCNSLALIKFCTVIKYCT